VTLCIYENLHALGIDLLGVDAKKSVAEQSMSFGMADTDVDRRSG
jgi:hypothetical protein